jgi:quercetin dioxygenase-like cupin family protein
MKLQVVVAIALLGSALHPSATRAEDAVKGAPTHRVFLPNDIHWEQAPPGFPPKTKIAVLHGDPTAKGPFAMRVLIPAGYSVPPHSHPEDENVTVISGEISVGVGDTFDAAKGSTLPAGSVSIMPAGLRHFLWTTMGAVIEVHGIGPWGITFVNPEDDPRGTPPAAK